MDVPAVENLLDYVYTEEDFSDSPSTKEYKKLQRIMQVMVNFYVRGTENKKTQLEDVAEQMKKMEVDLQMILEQKDVLKQFPPFHPKRSEYETDLDREYKNLSSQKEEYVSKEKEFAQLYEWSQGIVKSVKWLQGNLEDYANSVLLMDPKLEVRSLEMSSEQFFAYIRGLNEITYNLQESQDFFNASLDGRLRTFHQLEKCMIEAQLQIIRKYPEDSPRRMFIENELIKDLEYVENNMKENPKVISHREKMLSMHQDFFALLKWQRKRLKRLLTEEPEKISGDHEELKKKLVGEKEYRKEQGKGKPTKYHGEESNGHSPANGHGTGKGSSGPSAETPEALAALSAIDKCPIPKEVLEEKRKQGMIHKFYD